PLPGRAAPLPEGVPPRPRTRRPRPGDRHAPGYAHRLLPDQPDHLADADRPLLEGPPVLPQRRPAGADVPRERLQPRRGEGRLLGALRERGARRAAPASPAPARLGAARRPPAAPPVPPKLQQPPGGGGVEVGGT